MNAIFKDQVEKDFKNCVIPSPDHISYVKINDEDLLKCRQN